MLYCNDLEWVGVGFGDGIMYLGLFVDFFLDVDGIVVVVYYGCYVDD